jgi:hypothetical protein
MQKINYFLVMILYSTVLVSEEAAQTMPQKTQSQRIHKEVPKKTTSKVSKTTKIQKVNSSQKSVHKQDAPEKSNIPAQEIKVDTKEEITEKISNNTVPAGTPTDAQIPAGAPTPAVPAAHQYPGQLIDAIVIIVFSEEGIEIITRSDIERPSLSGAPRTADDIIFERLVYLDAKKHKILPDEDAVDKYLAAIQREHNLKPEELQMIFLSAGYTLEEGREQLFIMQAVSTMLDYKIRSNLIVPRKQIEAYYHDNPEYEEASYLISYTKIPFDSSQSEQQRIELEQRAKTGDFIGVLWEGPFWVSENELATDKQFITQLEVGQISAPYLSTDGFEIYRLEEKKPRRLKTYEERYRDIVDILRRPKYEELLENYRKLLFSKARVEYVQQ